MRGKINTQESLFVCVRLESMIPKGHILRSIKEHIDFSFIDKHVENLYSSKGRPSIDPQVLIRMMLIGYLFGITSERRLCEEVQLNLAYRWFCGLSLEDKIPDHSSFTKNRNGRFAGTTFFKDLFYEIVKQAQVKGLIRGKNLTTDATLIDANASLASLSPIMMPFTHEEYLNKLSEEKKVLPLNAIYCSRTDPEACLAKKRFNEKSRLSYSNNLLVDSENNIIVDVEVTKPGSSAEGSATASMLERTQFRLGMVAETLSADSAYNDGAFVNRLKATGVKAYIAPRKMTPKSSDGIFLKEQFTYITNTDHFICPSGKLLHRVKDSSRPRFFKYTSTKQQCLGCSLKSQCTRGSHRSVSINCYQKAIIWADNLRQSSFYKKAQYLRRRIERLFGEAKEQMGLRRARMRGKKNVSEQCILTAMAQNIKRIVKAKTNFDSPEDLQQALMPYLNYLNRALNHLISFLRFNMSGIMKLAVLDHS